MNKKTKVNEKCFCSSNKKYKKCCLNKSFKYDNKINQ